MVQVRPPIAPTPESSPKQLLGQDGNPLARTFEPQVLGLPPINQLYPESIRDLSEGAFTLPEAEPGEPPIQGPVLPPLDYLRLPNTPNVSSLLERGFPLRAYPEYLESPKSRGLGRDKLTAPDVKTVRQVTDMAAGHLFGLNNMEIGADSKVVLNTWNNAYDENPELLRDETFHVFGLLTGRDIDGELIDSAEEVEFEYDESDIEKIEETKRDQKRPVGYEWPSKAIKRQTILPAYDPTRPALVVTEYEVERGELYLDGAPAAADLISGLEMSKEIPAGLAWTANSTKSEPVMPEYEPTKSAMAAAESVGEDDTEVPGGYVEGEERRYPVIYRKIVHDRKIVLEAYDPEQHGELSAAKRLSSAMAVRDYEGMPEKDPAQLPPHVQASLDRATVALSRAMFAGVPMSPVVYGTSAAEGEENTSCEQMLHQFGLATGFNVSEALTQGAEVRQIFLQGDDLKALQLEQNHNLPVVVDGATTNMWLANLPDGRQIGITKITLPPMHFEGYEEKREKTLLKIGQVVKQSK